MRITFIGTGTCVDTSRAQSCVKVECRGEVILVDVGVGSFSRVDYGKIEAVLITHNHLDHNADLLPILKARWLSGLGPLKIFGPKGTKAYLESLIEAYPYLRRKVKYSVSEEDRFRVGRFSVRTIPTRHSIISRAYVIECGGKRVVVSGDTSPVEEIFDVDCDLLIHEMSLPSGRSNDHTTPDTFSEYLRECKAERVYLTHMYPQTLEVRDRIVDRLRGIKKEVYAAEDMMSVEV